MEQTSRRLSPEEIREARQKLMTAEVSAIKDFIGHAMDFVDQRYPDYGSKDNEQLGNLLSAYLLIVGPRLDFTQEEIVQMALDFGFVLGRRVNNEYDDFLPEGHATVLSFFRVMREVITTGTTTQEQYDQAVQLAAKFAQSFAH